MIRTLLMAIGCAALAAAPAAAQRFPARPADGVADLAGLLSPAAEDSVRALLHELRGGPGVEVAVLTVRSIGEFRAGGARPEAFATAVYNDWALGYGHRQDGVLVLVSVQDRFARIELGDGVPAYMDGRARRIMEETMVPRFRRGEYQAGVLLALRAISAAFGASAAPVAPTPAGPEPAPVARNQKRRPDAEGSGTGWLVAGLAAVAAAGIVHAARSRSPRRDCPRCGLRMRLLDERADNRSLDAGQSLEETLGTVNYDVWECAGCGNRHVLRARNPHGKLEGARSAAT